MNYKDSEFASTLLTQIYLVTYMQNYKGIARFCYTFSAISCSTAEISAGAHLREVKFSLCKTNLYLKKHKNKIY